MTPAELRRDISSSLALAIGPLGFIKKGQFLIRRRTTMTTDWLAIVANGRRGGPLEATINVGVHCAPLHKLVSELTSDKYSEIVATFATNIGYLHEDHAYHEWTFDRSTADSSILDDIAATVINVAIPFVEQFTGASSVRRGCERFGIDEYNRVRLPALETLTGNVDEARALLESGTAAIQFRHDAAAEYFRAFADRLRQRLDSSLADS